MVLVLSVQFHALVVLHMHLQLVVAHHCVAEQAELVTGLLLLVCHQFMGKVFLNGLMDFLCLGSLMLCEDFVGIVVIC